MTAAHPTAARHGRGRLLAVAIALLASLGFGTASAHADVIDHDLRQIEVAQRNLERDQKKVDRDTKAVAFATRFLTTAQAQQTRAQQKLDADTAHHVAPSRLTNDQRQVRRAQLVVVKKQAMVDKKAAKLKISTDKVAADQAALDTANAKYTADSGEAAPGTTPAAPAPGPAPAA